jgi:hypothetical protein
MISDIAAGSCMKGNARGALLLRGSRVGASCGEITRHDGWSEARPIKSAREAMGIAAFRPSYAAVIAMSEATEAIHRAAQRKAGLLRFARYDAVKSLGGRNNH